MRSRALSLIAASTVACVPAPEPGMNVEFIERPPPTLLIENVGIPPQPGLIWMRGFWRWNGADFVWTPGQWIAVRSGYRAWEPGRWVRTRRGWYFIEGHWR